MKRDFLQLTDFSLAEHQALFVRAHALKAARQQKQVIKTLEGRTLALIMEKASTRTKVSFEAAITQLGGIAINLGVSESQIKRGEPLSDTARVLSGYVDAIVFRTFGDERLHELAHHARVPVINGLSDGGHPVQILADLLTIEEELGPLRGKTVAWVGDAASNMANSWMEAARLFGLQLRIAAPKGYQPVAQRLAQGGDFVELAPTVEDAVRGADVVSTDVWTSMGQEEESAQRRAALSAYQVDAKLLELAAPHAIVLHCLPAHRGEEISAEVLEGPRSRVWQEAENRMHVQKALLEKLLLG